jgi:hypothetical protein
LKFATIALFASALSYNVPIDFQVYQDEDGQLYYDDAEQSYEQDDRIDSYQGAHQMRPDVRRIMRPQGAVPVTPTPFTRIKPGLQSCENYCFSNLMKTDAGRLAACQASCRRKGVPRLG